MTDQDDFRPPRKPPWPFQQTQHQYMQSDSETAKQRIQKPPRTSKTSKTTNRQPTTATTPTTARRFKQVQAERRTPKTRTGTQSKQHLPSRTRSACDITKNQDKPILLHGATRCGTVWGVAHTTTSQNEDTRSKYTTTQRHPEPSNQSNDPDQQLSSKNQARNPIQNTSTTKPRKTSLSINTEDKQT